jgi:hypothetical protein
MSDVEKAKALLTAAGVSGVEIREAEETVTVSRSELDALRAAQAAPAATVEPEQPVAGVPLPPEQAALAAAAVGPMPPAGKAPLATQEDVEALSSREFEARWDEVQAVLRSGN